jgi:hypothetical protein
VSEPLNSEKITPIMIGSRRLLSVINLDCISPLISDLPLNNDPRNEHTRGILFMKNRICLSKNFAKIKEILVLEKIPLK